MIYDPGCYPGGPELKCTMCGRRPTRASGPEGFRPIGPYSPEGFRPIGPYSPEGRRIMETEKKTCIKCNKEFPKTEEYFRKNHATKDGFEGQCKTCRRKYFADYRAGKRARSKPGKNIGQKQIPKPIRLAGPSARQVKKTIGLADRQVDPVSPVILNSANPYEIVAALRKGFAREMIQLIEEKWL